MSAITDSNDLFEHITNRFPGKVTQEGRPGFRGIVVEPDGLVELVTYLRDEIGYDYLSCLTAVDDYPEDKFEVVYIFNRSVGGEELEIKVFISRQKAVLDSITPLFQGADFQEREVWDMYGIRFEDHYDLRRLLMWEGFDGFPLRKDWKEPLFEEEVKPFKNRWPEGKGFRLELTNPYQDNVKYPKDFDPQDWTPLAEQALIDSFKSPSGHKQGELNTDQYLVNIGPQHPSTHGVFRMVALLEGETVIDLKPVFGYMHRNHEKIGERNTFLQIMPYTDRLDYLASMSNNFGYAITIEKLLGIEPPERAQYLRVIMAELTRIASHTMSIGFLLNDLGAFFTPSLYALEERELILDIFESVAGSRMMCNYFRFGGVVRDLTDADFKAIHNLVENRLPRKIDDLDRYLTGNEIVQSRCQGVGVLTGDEAIAYSAAGPILRASGIPYDIRRAAPYGIYDRFDFEVCYRNHGDVYDRYLVRLDEIRQSLRILKQALRDMPTEGPVMAGKVNYMMKVPAGESYGRVEGPRGELGYYVVSDGKSNPKRYHVRAPSMINLTGLAKMCIGGKIADAVTILGAVDIVLGEVDR